MKSHSGVVPIVFDRRLTAIALTGLCSFVDLYSTQSLLPELARVFSASEARVALTVTATTLAVALAGPLVGGIADMIGRKAMIVAGALLLTVPTLLLGLAGSLDSMLVLRFLQGLCMPFVFTVTVAYIGEEFSAVEMPGAIAVYTTGGIIGGFSGRLITSLVAEPLGWRMSFVVLAGVNLAAALAVWAWLPPARNFVRSGGLGQTLRAMGRHLMDPPLIATCATGFAVLFAMTATFTYANFYLAAPPFGLSTAALGWVFTVYLAGAVTTGLSARLIRRLGRRGALAAAVVVATGGLLLTLLPHLTTVLAGLTLLSVGVFICQTAATGFVGSCARDARSAAVGLYVCCYYVGGSLGAVAPAPLWARMGWPGCVALVTAALTVALVLATLFWNPARLGRVLPEAAGELTPSA